MDEESSETVEEGDADSVLGWLDADCLDAADRSHVSAGLWAIDTVNPNAWPGTSRHAGIACAHWAALL